MTVSLSPSSLVPMASFADVASELRTPDSPGMHVDSPAYDSRGEVNVHSYVSDLAKLGIGGSPSSSPISRYSHPRAPPSTPMAAGMESLSEGAVPSSRVTMTLRGSGSAHPSARVRRREGVRHPDKFRPDAKAQTKFYTQDCERRANQFRVGRGGWDLMTNEVEFKSSVPTVSGRFPRREDDTYRSLTQVVETLDRVGTKAKCPLQMSNNTPDKERDFGHVGSKIKRIWTTESGGRQQTQMSPKRPTDYFVRGLQLK